MCADCWQKAGSPTERTAETDELVDLIDKLYLDHVTGGPLHAVLDDWNLDGHIEPYCDGWATKDLADGTRETCDRIAAILNGMTPGQRYAALAYANGLAG
jgi:hypothetical protein